LPPFYNKEVLELEPELIERWYFLLGLGLGIVCSVHWTRSDSDTCLKVDICHHFNGSNTPGH